MYTPAINEFLQILNDHQIILLGEDHLSSRVVEFFLANPPLLAWLARTPCNIYSEDLITLPHHRAHNQHTLSKRPFNVFELENGFYQKIVRCTNIKIFGLICKNFCPFAHLSYEESLHYIQRNHLVDPSLYQQIINSIDDQETQMWQFIIKISHNYLRQNKFMAANIINYLRASTLSRKHICITGMNHIDTVTSKNDGQRVAGLKELLAQQGYNAVSVAISQQASDLVENEVATNMHVDSGEDILSANYHFSFNKDHFSKEFTHLDRTLPPQPRLTCCAII